MITTEIEVAAPVDAVFATLADPYTYPEWLVGAHEIRSVEGDWPSSGARFHHRFGVWPVHIPDSTSVVEVEPPSRLVLHARARPAGTARVEFELEPVNGDHTKVQLREAPESGPVRILWRLGARPVMEPGLRARNERSLERLRSWVETPRRAASTSRGHG